LAALDVLVLKAAWVRWYTKNPLASTAIVATMAALRRPFWRNSGACTMTSGGDKRAAR
jgi:hypothetical protein